MTRYISGVLLVMLLWVSLASAAAASQKTWNDVVDSIEQELQKAVDTYKNGDIIKAKNYVNEAYFGPYEGQQMEKAVRLNVSAKANANIEEKFRQIKKAITAKQDVHEIESKVDLLIKDLRSVAREMDGDNSSTFGVFLSSFLIIVREGFEAILVIGAIMAYLVKSGNQNKIKTIYQGVFLALLTSFATAFAIKSLFNISGASQEVLEGITMLIAVVVLFSVSFWLASKVEAKKWQDYIQGKVQSSLGKGSTFALWFAAFLAVYREGAETVLFYLAMFSGADQSHTNIIVLGMVVGFAVLAVLFIVVRFGSLKLPLKPFFLVTSILMYYLAFTFAGQGINELQAGGMLGVTSISIPTIGVLGIFPTAESVGLQVLLIITAVAGLIYQKFSGSKSLTGTKQA